MKLLHLDSSILGDKSVSRAISAAIVGRLVTEHPGLEITYRDLAAEPVDHATLRTLTDAQATQMLEEFLAADIIVIGAGFYNFTIPSQLKAWIDRILIVGRTFRYNEQGRPEGLAGGRRMIFALSRGGVYGEGSPIAQYEHAETLLRTTFGFIGIRDIEFIIAEGVSRGDEVRRAAVESALAQASQVSARQLAA